MTVHDNNLKNYADIAAVKQSGPARYVEHPSTEVLATATTSADTGVHFTPHNALAAPYGRELVQANPQADIYAEVAKHIYSGEVTLIGGPHEKLAAFLEKYGCEIDHAASLPGETVLRVSEANYEEIEKRLLAHLVDDMTKGEKAAETIFGIPAHLYNAGVSFGKFAEVCHKQSVAAGWWTDIKTCERLGRSVPELLALIHSELSEALEGLRKGKMDDHLPHYQSVTVELADAAIRIGDIAKSQELPIELAIGSVLNVTGGYANVLMQMAERPSDNIAYIHAAVSSAHGAWRGCKAPLADRLPNTVNAFTGYLAVAIIMIAAMAEKHGLDLPGAIVEKLQYNANRADHKIENRLLEGGKKF
jgi:hypothetical protein